MGLSFQRAVWIWVGYYTVVVLLIHFLRNLDGFGVLSDDGESLMALGRELPLEGADSLPIAGRTLGEPL